MNPPPRAHPRPGKVVLVAGTGTGVGKTWAAAAIAQHLRSLGLTVAARKPAQSFDPQSPAATDAEVLAGATGEAPTAVCPAHRWYPTPLAPPMAASALAMPTIQLADLVTELSWPATPVDIGLVETAGGVRSPLAEDGDTVDLARAAKPDLVVLVADADLGTINLVRLSTDALDRWSQVILLNRFNPRSSLHNSNRQWLASHVGHAMCTTISAASRSVLER